jgi:hypothetical protein
MCVRCGEVELSSGIPHRLRMRTSGNPPLALLTELSVHVCPDDGRMAK